VELSLHDFEDGLKKFNPHHDPKTGEFAEGAGGKPQKLNPKEMLALVHYTGGGYHEMNECLRGTESCTKSAKESIDALKDGLGKCSPGPDQVFRGVNYKGNAKQVLSKFKEGAAVSDKGFLSTSADKRVAETMASVNSEKGQTSVIFTLSGKSGFDISKLSNIRAEKEVLFQPGAKFRVASARIVSGRVEVRLK